MAATGKTPILLYGSTTATNQPSAGNLTNSSDGCEIAINVADKNLFFKDSTNTVNTVPIRQSSASSNGWLSSTDWSTFNGKVSSPWLTSGSNIYYTAGNIGLNTSPSAWATYVAFQNGGTSVADYNNGNNAIFGSNMYFNGSAFKYIATGQYASNYRMYSGTHEWNIAPTGTAGNDITFTTAMQISTAGNVTVNTGNLVIGTSGKGIDFSATAGTGTSELLADYEEGTWTPTLNNFTGTASAVGGTYRKIGNMVYVFGVIVPTTTIATVVASSYVSGLPYAPGTNGQIVNWCTDYTGRGEAINVGSNLYTPTIAAYGGAFYFSITYYV